jgi:hypothetical protein
MPKKWATLSLGFLGIEEPNITASAILYIQYLLNSPAPFGSLQGKPKVQETNYLPACSSAFGVRGKDKAALRC